MPVTKNRLILDSRARTLEGVVVAPQMEKARIPLQAAWYFLGSRKALPTVRIR
jgi:hypothetical protein